jgi:hypothetical protein
VRLACGRFCWRSAWVSGTESRPRSYKDSIWLPKNVTKAIILLEIVEIIHSTRCTEYLLTKSMTYCEGSKTVKRPYFLSYMNAPIAGVCRRGATSL